MLILACSVAYALIFIYIPITGYRIAGGVIVGVVIIGLGWVLVERFKEIGGGETDDLSNY